MKSTKENTAYAEVNDYLLAVGDQVKKLRKRKDFSQESLAEALSVSSMTIYRIENGVTPMNILLLMKLAEILEVSPEEILMK